METVAVTLVWLGCLLTYLNASKRKLLSNTIQPETQQLTLKKIASWTAFALCLSLAVICYNTIYSYTVSLLLITLFVMMIWLLLAILLGHFPRRFYRINLGIISLFWIVSALGKIHAR